jgi:putative tryptophan/tyrosine transport system substrate-binding protein
MRRREFIALLGGLAAAWPPETRAQQTAMPVIGFLSSASAPQFGHLVAAFRRGLSEAGFVEGQNVLIEYRWADGDYKRLPALTAELVNRPVTALAATGGSAVAAKAASSTVPVVFITTDPVRSGLVRSLSRPDGNMTGVAFMTASMEPKRLEMLQELAPAAVRFAALINPNSHLAPSQTKDLLEAGRHIGRPIEILHASTAPELDTAFSTLGQAHPSTLLVTADAFFNSRREQIVTLAARHSVPAIYEWREFVEAGGLMSYGPSITNVYRQVGIYIGRILKGAKPADLPVLQPTKFEFVINLKAAKALGLQVPTTLLARADEVIE